MPNKVIQEIFVEFDKIIKKLDSESDKDVVNELKKDEADFNLIKQWREEIGQSKQSIYVIGETSAGKSEFHNFLLDVKSKNELLFKTSTKVETGFLQTLQHTNFKNESYVKLSIKDKDNFKKLVVPQNIGNGILKETAKIPLETAEQVAFLRENIMAKPSSKNDYVPAKALSRIDIFYPMKLFRNFIFIDTPGLGSYNSATDNTVREYIKGKSHIFWFLDASKKTLSDSISLIEKEKALFCDTKVRQRIIFFANMFDLIDIEDENSDKNSDGILEDLKIEIIDTLNDSLNKILEIRDANISIIFTSFKYLDKKLGNSTTRKEMNKLEEQLSSNKIDRDFDNIKSLTKLLHKILNKINENIVTKKKNSISIEINELENIRGVIKETIKRTADLKNVINDSIERSREKLGKIDKIENRKDYKKCEDKFRKNLIAIHYRLEATRNAHFKNIASNESKEIIENIKNLTKAKFNTKEPLWFLKKIKYLDSELKININKLNEIIKLKKSDINLCGVLLHKDINKYKYDISRELERIKKDIINKNQALNGIASEIDTIKKITKSFRNIDKLLQDDVENRISEWRPTQGENCQYTILKNFLQLNSLLNEHDVVINRKGALINESHSSATT